MKVLLFSGGVDSTALAWTARPDRLLFVDYGQRAAAGELRASRSIAAELDLVLDERRVDLAAFGRGSMTGPAALPGLPPENWPYRNQMLITLAAMTYADAPRLVILLGTVASDAEHPDGRPAFLDAIDETLRVQSGARVEAPSRHLATLDLVRSSGLPRGTLGWTFSCHTGEWACGQCRGCCKRAAVVEAIDAARPRP